MTMDRSLRWRLTLVFLALMVIPVAAAIFRWMGLLHTGYLIAGFLSALVAALLSIGLGYLAVRRAARSVRAVTEGARRLAQGDLAHRVQAPASRDTRELAQVFNAMADALHNLVQNLSGERDKLTAVLATMSDGVVVIDARGVVLMLNQAASDLLGLAEQKVEGRHLVETVRDYALHQLVSRCVASGQQQHGEVELLLPRRVLSAVATSLQESGSPGVLLTFHDLTRARQMETSQKEFVSNVSHELRNPLASVKAMVETLEEGALREPQVATDFLSRIHRDVDRMARLVNDLLALSRLESGQLPLEPRPLDLLPLAAEIAGQFQERASAQKVLLDIHLPEGLPQILGDPDRLGQVLVNLLDNALKFTSSQGTVTISASALAPDLVQVQVKDTGSGIAREHLPHVFQRFYKADRSRHEGGTGLGLAIVKQIVEAHGGQVQVESQEGAGSTFTFTVPRAR